jgi:toxin ParE1/3/4
MTVKWTKAALAGLGQIADYIGQDNPKRATSFIQELREKTTALAHFPGMGRPGRVIRTRELVVHKNYIVAYRVRGDDVEVLRVHHVAKRWPERFD